MRQLGIFLDQYVYTFADEWPPRIRVEVPLHTVFLLSQPLFGLLEVIGYAVFGEEGRRLELVVLFCRFQERDLEMLFVHIQTNPVDIGLIEAERYERAYDFLDKFLVNLLAVSLALNESEDSTGQLAVFVLDVYEEVIFP